MQRNVEQRLYFAGAHGGGAERRDSSLANSRPPGPSSFQHASFENARSNVGTVGIKRQWIPRKVSEDPIPYLKLLRSDAKQSVGHTKSMYLDTAKE